LIAVEGAESFKFEVKSLKLMERKRGRGVGGGLRLLAMVCRGSSNHGGLELDGRGEEIEEGFGGADAKAAEVVEIEGADGGAACGGEANQVGVLPGEVI